MGERRIEASRRTTPHDLVHCLILPLRIRTDDRFVLLQRRDEQIGMHGRDGESEEREEERRTRTGPIYKGERSANERQKADPRKGAPGGEAVDRLIFGMLADVHGSGMILDEAWVLGWGPAVHTIVEPSYIANL